MKGADELPAFRTGSLDDLLPLVSPQRYRCEDWCGDGNRVRCEGEDELDRELGPRYCPGRSCADLGIDDNRIAPNLEQGELRGWRLQIVRAGKQLDELAPADRPVVRVGCRLRQHRVQAIVETHRGIRFLQDRSFPDLVARAPTEGVAA